MNKKGFTLVETMVAAAIVSVLGLFSVVGINAAKIRAQQAVEISAARNLTQAYMLESVGNGGRLMEGYKSDPEAENLNGEKLYHPVNARYPWRLIPHLEKVEGVMFYNGNERFLKDSQSDYLVSVMPNLGMNAVYVGGHYGSGSPLRPSPRLVEKVGKFYVDRMSEVFDASQLLVFASARHGKGQSGHFEVRAPNTLKKEWSENEFSKDSPASKYGFVDFRWPGKKAVAAFLDGSVELMDEEQLRDMRYWSNQAAQQNDPDFTVSIQK